MMKMARLYWSTVPGNQQKQKPSVMITGTSNIKEIDPAGLSSYINTESHISYAFAEAVKVIDDSVNKGGKNAKIKNRYNQIPHLT